MDRYLGTCMHLSFFCRNGADASLVGQVGMGGPKAPASGEKDSWLWPSRTETIRQ